MLLQSCFSGGICAADERTSWILITYISATVSCDLLKTSNYNRPFATLTKMFTAFITMFLIFIKTFSLLITTFSILTEPCSITHQTVHKTYHTLTSTERLQRRFQYTDSISLQYFTGKSLYFYPWLITFRNLGEQDLNSARSGKPIMADASRCSCFHAVYIYPMEIINKIWKTL